MLHLTNGGPHHTPILLFFLFLLPPPTVKILISSSPVSCSLPLSISHSYSFTGLLSLTHHHRPSFLRHTSLVTVPPPPRFCSLFRRYSTPSLRHGLSLSPSRFSFLSATTLLPWQLGLLIWLSKFTIFGKYLGISVLVNEFLI